MTVLMYERLTIGFGSECFGSPTELSRVLGPTTRRTARTPTCAGDWVT